MEINGFGSIFCICLLVNLSNFAQTNLNNFSNKFKWQKFENSCRKKGPFAACLVFFETFRPKKSRPKLSIKNFIAQKRL